MSIQISLDPITPENKDDCLSLDVYDHQRGYVCPVRRSFEYLKTYKYSVPLAIKIEDEVIGFVLYEPLAPGSNDGFMIWGFLIDKTQQGKGYGYAAMVELIDLLRTKHGARRFSIAHVPGNAAAARLYHSLGFSYTGTRNSDGEVEMELVFS